MNRIIQIMQTIKLYVREKSVVRYIGYDLMVNTIIGKYDRTMKLSNVWKVKRMYRIVVIYRLITTASNK